MVDTLLQLEATIASRRSADPGTSYVAALFAGGGAKIAQKVGEEAVETVIAALSGSRAAIASEAADLLFHLMVLLEATGVPLAQVLAELDRREGLSGLDEKAARPAAVPRAAPPEDGEAAAPPGPALALGREPGARPLIRKG